MNIIKFLNKILPSISLCIFVFLTLTTLCCISPGEAEAHAWTIAGNANLWQIIDLMNIEGHFIVWYLCLMPFAKFPNLYHWVMDLINWGFCFGAIFVLWKKAPFNNFIKFCITFSAPFLKVYAIYPRCYSIGILLLFLAMALYKERFLKPYKYLLLLAIAANTSLPALIGAGTLGLLFMFEIACNKKEELKFSKTYFLAVSALIITLNIVLFYFQFHNVSLPDYETKQLIKAPYTMLAYFGQSEYFTKVNLFKTFLLWIGTIVFPILFWQNKKAFIFFMSSEICAVLFFTFVYGARFYHTCFLFIYAIIAFWMLKSEDDSHDKFDWRTIVFSILAINMIFINIKHEPADLDMLVYPITNDEILTEGTLYSNIEPIRLSVLLPVLAKKSQTIYDMNGRNLNSIEALRLYFNKNAKNVDPDCFAALLDNHKRNFIILNGSFRDRYIQGKKYRFDVILYKLYRAFEYDTAIRIYEIKNIRKF